MRKMAYIGCFAALVAATLSALSENWSAMFANMTAAIWALIAAKKQRK